METTLLTTFLASAAGEWDHAWWPLWPLLWLAVLGTIVLLLTRRRWSGGRRPTGTDRAREILAERYASGEITTDEYRERLEQLR